MFGVDEDKVDAEQARLDRRRRRWKRALVTLAELVLFGPMLAVVALVWLVGTPDGIAWLVERYGTDEHRRISVLDATIHPASRWNDPATWRLILDEVDIVPHEAGRPTLHLDQLILTMPDVEALWYRREFVVEQAWLVGLHIQAKQQRPAPKRQPGPNSLRLFKADLVHVWDASYDAPADDPLPPAGVVGIYGTLSPVQFDPFTREPTGVAVLQARRFHTGTLFLRNIRIGKITAEQGDLRFDDGRLDWEGQRARVHGTIDNIDSRSKVAFTVSLRQARVERLVSNATGEASPIFGLADVDLRVFSGGDLPRGAGYMDAHLEIADAMIPLPSDTRGIYKDVIRLAPIARLDDKDQVHLDAMVGDLTLSRGVVHLKELLYESRIPVVVRGDVDAEQMDLYVRFVLGGDPHVHPGRGLRLKGPLNAPVASWASRDELLPGWRELRDERRNDRRLEREQRRAEGKPPKWLVPKKKQQAAAADSPPPTP